MAVFELELRLVIMKYALLNMKRIASNRSCLYEEKTAFIVAAMEYLFAFYAAYGKQRGTDVDVTVESFIHEFTGSDMKDFVRSLGDVRNRLCHLIYIPETIRIVNAVWSDPKLMQLLSMINDNELPYTKDNPRMRIKGISPFDTMAGE